MADSFPDDAVDRILEQWRRVRPDLDASPMGTIGRLHRLAAELDRRLRWVFAEEGLGNGDFDVVATLRRNEGEAGGDSSEPEQGLTPSELMGQMMVTSGAVTKRVDRLAARGLVSRSAHPRDARSSVIRLTTVGRELVDRLVAAHLDNERWMMEVLSDDERETLTSLIKTWGTRLESRPDRRPASA